MPKGFTNAKGSKSKARNVLDEHTVDPFGERPKDELYIDWSPVHAENIKTIISRVCHAGGFVSFAAGAGGESIKFSLSIGGASGFRWCRSGNELAHQFAVAMRAIDEYENTNRVALLAQGAPVLEPENKSAPKS